MVNEDNNLSKLCVFDIDDTLIEWEYSSGTVSYFPRTGAVDLLERLREDGFDLALFSTANNAFVSRVANEHFSDFTFLAKWGRDEVTIYKGEKVKDLSLFTRLGYNIENIVLIDDKVRNGRLQPNNLIVVRPPKYFRDKDKMDVELLNLYSKIKNWYTKKTPKGVF